LNLVYERAIVVGVRKLLEIGSRNGYGHWGPVTELFKKRLASVCEKKVQTSLVL